MEFQCHLSGGGNNYGTFICDRFLDHIKKYTNKITDIFMFYRSSNVQPGEKLLKYNYQILASIRVVWHSFIYFSIMLIKYQLQTKLLHIKSQYTTYLII